MELFIRRVYVVDTGHLLRNLNILRPDEEYYTCPGVIEELKDKRATDYYLRYEPFLKVVTHDEQSMKIATAIAELTGDICKLSKTDMNVFATAIYLTRKLNLRLRSPKECYEYVTTRHFKKIVQESDVELKLLTGDRAIQNVALVIGILAENHNGRKLGYPRSYELFCQICGVKYKAEPIRKNCSKCGQQNLKYIEKEAVGLPRGT